MRPNLQLDAGAALTKLPLFQGKIWTWKKAVLPYTSVIIPIVKLPQSAQLSDINLLFNKQSCCGRSLEWRNNKVYRAFPSFSR